VTAGSSSEETQLAAARGAANGRGAANPTGPIPLDRGRPVFFYVDDLHLDPSSVYRTRRLLTKFVDQEMGQNDEAAITSASGQIGFLQQLTDNKTVLRAALAKLVFRNYSLMDSERPAMSEYNALRVNNYDRDLTDYFVDETMKQNPGVTRDSALALVLSRARALMAQAGRITSNTLAGLEGLVRSAKSIPGRKLVFFISDGFFLDGRNSDANFKLQRITSAAAKSGVVIYSIDARGLVTGFPDASSPSQVDPTGRLDRASMGELSASQDGLNALARDTGGKPYFNSNALEPAVQRALKETSTYYLLAWKPDPETKENRKFHRIEVKVVGKPGLSVQVRRGFFDIEPAPVASKTKGRTKQSTTENTPQAELSKVMSSPFPEREIPIALRLNYINVPDKGSMLSASMQVPHEFFSFAPVNGKETAVVELGGTVFNAKGQMGAKFNNRITITAATPETKRQDLTYGHPVFLGPGLYHVRVAARDEKSGRAGSAHGWIEIPDISKGQLTLSSVLLGTRPSKVSESAQKGQDPLDSIGLSVDNRFRSGDYLRFLVLVYNAARASSDSKPDVAIQIQIVRDDQPVVTTPLKKVSVEGLADLGRIPYAAEVSLAGLPSGRYLLRLTAVDRTNKTSASQQTRFEIQ
jgi:VWFA-related protein